MRCANCGSQQMANYCAQCGQNDRQYQRSLPPLLWDLLKETFEVDSRILRTLKLLLFVPGELTAEFSRNRRAGYVSPFRLYLFYLFGNTIQNTEKPQWLSKNTLKSWKKASKFGMYFRSPLAQD